MWMSYLPCLFLSVRFFVQAITSFSFMANLIVIMLPEVSYGSGFGVKQVLFLVVIVNIHSSPAFEWEIVKTSKPAQVLKSSYAVCISHTVKTSPDNTQSCIFFSCCFLHCIVWNITIFWNAVIVKFRRNYVWTVDFRSTKLGPFQERFVPRI